MSETAQTLPEPQSDSLVGLINQLADVPEPEAVSMVPQTAGWAVVAAVLLMCLAFWGWQRWKVYQANAYRREALKALEAGADDAAAISEILKRAALTAYGRRRVAALSGAEWLAFLDVTNGGPEEDFQRGAGRVLGAVAYRAQPISAEQDLRDLAQQWIRRHPARDALKEGADV
jgi:hypothetical protein